MDRIQQLWKARQVVKPPPPLDTTLVPLTSMISMEEIFPAMIKILRANDPTDRSDLTESKLAMIEAMALQGLAPHLLQRRPGELKRKPSTVPVAANEDFNKVLSEYNTAKRRRCQTRQYPFLQPPAPPMPLPDLRTKEKTVDALEASGPVDASATVEVNQDICFKK